MKYAKSIIAMLVVFAMTSGFTTKHSPSSLTQAFFEFSGYDVMEPNDWTQITLEPTCNYTSGVICYIKAEKQNTQPHPTAETLVDLYNNSNGFTTAYTGIYGKVRLKP